MQLRKEFKISCEFLLYGAFGKIILCSMYLILASKYIYIFIFLEKTNCSDHITQPKLLNGQWTGKFSPNDQMT